MQAATCAVSGRPVEHKPEQTGSTESGGRREAFGVWDSRLMRTGNHGTRDQGREQTDFKAGGPEEGASQVGERNWEGPATGSAPNRTVIAPS